MNLQVVRRLGASHSPLRLAAIANWCRKKQRVAVVLNRNGEVLVFKDRKLQFAKRRGAWRYYAHESVVQRFGVGNLSLRRSVYETCLDISFARTGGCIAIINAKQTRNVANLLANRDLLTKGAIPRTRLLADTVRKPFQHLDRRMRQELVSLDGATVLAHDGLVLAAGAIVKVGSGSDAGGRQAAAKALSALGLGVKISADGPITGFRKRRVSFQT